MGRAYISGSSSRFQRKVVISCAMISEIVTCDIPLARACKTNIMHHETYRDKEEQDLEHHEEEREVYPPESDDAQEEDRLDGDTDGNKGQEDEAWLRVVFVLSELGDIGHDRGHLGSGGMQRRRETRDEDRADASRQT